MCKAVTVPFFKHLAKSLAKNKEEEKPLFSQDEKKFERTPCEEENQLYFENTEEVNSFWRRLWQTEAKDNMDTTWIKEVEESMERKWARKKL